MGFLTYLIGLSGLAGAIILYCLKTNVKELQHSKHDFEYRPAAISHSENK